MKRLAIIGITAFAVIACGDDSPSTPQHGTWNTVPSDGTIPGDFYDVEVNGMDCILWVDDYNTGHHDRDSHSGLSCDWSNGL